jgi:quercetin dioxygenase-like cupin family protein
LSEREVLCEDLSLAIDELKGQGFRLDLIYPADDPQCAVLSSGGETVRLSTPSAPQLSDRLPRFEASFVLTRAGDTPGAGRAGMLYRDLIPSRLGGRYIASHITIPDGGPVADWVHYHRVAFQMIAVRRGWVRVVYEDQGEPFVMEAGDVVLQPPEIRHRVLESSPGLEVVEIGCPALHATFADHELALPTDRIDGGKSFGGQTFLRHIAKDTAWTPFHGWEAQETAMREATGGVASVRVLRPAQEPRIIFRPHTDELAFGFVLEGSATLAYSGDHALGPADAFVIPPGKAWELSSASDDFRLLHVTTCQLG